MPTPSMQFPWPHLPLRTLADVAAYEQVPLEERIFSWDVNDWMRRGCSLDPDKVAIHYVESGRPDGECVSIRYRELQARATQAANLFYSLGVGPGDAVFYIVPTMPQLVVVTMGAISTGIACCANWMLKGEHLLELIRSSKAKVVIALGPAPGYEIWENVQAIRAELPLSVKLISVRGPGGTALSVEGDGADLDALLDRQLADRLLFERRAKPDDLAAYVHSGGTTGSPKLVKLTHRGMAYKCWANMVVMAHTPEDVLFADYPMFHIAGIFGKCILVVANGMSMVIPSPIGARDKKFIANYWKFVERFKVTIMSGVPTTLSVLAKHPPTTEDIRSLRPYMCTGSTAMPAEVAREIQQGTGVRVLATYGATEFTQNVTQAPRDGDPKYGSGGLRLPYTEVKIVKLDAGGRIERECATEEIGAVIMRGPSITPGYVDSKYDAGMFVEGGWINNGDLGRIDVDGYLWLTGRAKDLIIRGGHNIDPTMIEDTLRRHKDVLISAAVSKPDAYAGELPVAYVELVKGSRASAADIEAFVREHISERAAAPKEVFLLERMPLTDIGKPDKVFLRRDAAERSFAAALRTALGKRARIAVRVQPDATHGTIAVIGTSAGEDKVAEVMKAYTMHYRIEREESA